MIDVQIKKIDAADIASFKELIHVFEEVFEMENFNLPTEDYLKQVLADKGFLAFVAILDNHVIGGLTAYILKQYYRELPLVYIYDLAVKAVYQRKGVGRQLISGITNYSKTMGVEEIFVQAEEADKHALDFYQTTGGIAEKVVHFSYPLNR